MPDNVDKPIENTDVDYHARIDALEKQLENFEHEALVQLKEFRRKFDQRFHLVYIFVAFTGVTLVWYSLWTIISEIPIIENPYVAGGLGIIILLILGKFFDRLV